MNLRTQRTQSSSTGTIVVGIGSQLSESLEVLHGIRENGHWQTLPMAGEFEHRLPGLLASRAIDGVIGEFISDTWIASIHPPQGIPLINVSCLSEIRHISSIEVDYFAAGVHAAEHFRRVGISAFSCLHRKAHYGAEQLRRGFRSCISDEQFSPLDIPTLSMLGEALRRLPTPTGLLCSDDYLARLAIHNCSQEGLRVPDDIAIIGIGNSEIDSLYSEMPISSVHIPYREIGFHACEQLQKEMAEPDQLPNVIRIPPGALIERESSLRQTGPQRMVARAQSFLRENLANPISILDVSRHVGVSRRYLELHFREHTGTSPYQALQQMRLDSAQRLLTQTSLRIGEIAAMSGWPEAHRFSTFFRSRTGCSPRDYRAAATRR